MTVFRNKHRRIIHLYFLFFARNSPLFSVALVVFLFISSNGSLDFHFKFHIFHLTCRLELVHMPIGATVTFSGYDGMPNWSFHAIV